MNNFPESSYVDMNLAKKVYFTFLIFSFLWVLLIFLAPFLSKEPGIAGNIAKFIYLFFSKVCHQEDVRSFHLFGNILGVCSRCVWIYLGFFAGICIYPLKYKLNNTESPSIIILMIVSLILGIDVFLDITDLLKNTFLSRSVTGFMIGIILPFFIVPGFVIFFYEINSFLRNKMKYKFK